ncbi:aromatic-L-amino-acid decarboxylase [Pseudomonas mucidolens]|uniref:Aromatic-L-amino-acid decarboxylase n=1 Tax=Pseudomonas mucidolens TaxID=46679 RepID=A0A1H2MQH0_9PSED|nr:aromatic-L-amino-acid decarboxylase [Pseudomonas mucidolens]SQH33464.1 putative pyridoxal-dependent decarboxylase [Pseudomonas mucidolens]
MEKAPTQIILQDACERAAGYLQGIKFRPILASSRAVQRLEELRHGLPYKGVDALEVVRQLDEIGSPATVATAGGRYFGLVIGGALPVTVAANWLATAWDQNACFRWTSPIAATLEDVSLLWLRELFGLPPETAGAFVSGASMASFSALAAARHALLARQGWDVEALGLYGAPQLRVVVSEEIHVTVLKALALLGLGRECVIRVPTDKRGRLQVDQMPTLDDRTIVCIQAGNVNTGDFDPAAEVCRLARAAGAWVHVDGALGLWALANPALSVLTDGFAEADSWATDGHKWLNVPYDSGIVLVRQAAYLRAAMSMSAAYLAGGVEGDREPSHYTPESSRRARGVEIWAALLHLGRDGLVALVAQYCRQALQFAQGLAAYGYEILNEVVLNQVLVSFGSARTTLAVIEAIQAEGVCWCGGTVWQGRTAMRISVANLATTELDVELSLQAIDRAVEKVRLDSVHSDGLGQRKPGYRTEADQRPGKNNENRMVPGSGCSTLTSPPCSCMIAVTIARPRPYESEL